MQLGLGTVQFGLSYGISNRAGQVTESEAAAVLHSAMRHGVDLVDTAARYGESERILGQHAAGMRIVTKFELPGRERVTAEDAKELKRGVLRSLHRLRRQSVYGLLAHDASDLLKKGGDHVFEAMLQVREQGWAQKIGVSIYSGAEIDALLRRYPLELLQVPLNVLDQRLLISGQLHDLACRGIEVHARSVFLQGLLLMEPARLGSAFAEFRSHLELYQDWRRRNGLSAIAACLAFVRQVSSVNCAIVGVTSMVEFEEIIAAWQTDPAPMDFSFFARTEERLLAPSAWPSSSRA